MPVYVDDMHTTDMGRFRAMRMCHMIASTDEELHAMADVIGVARRWWQAPPKHNSHYDIAMTKRSLALQHGAIECTMREAVYLTRSKRVNGVMCSLDEARAYFEARALEFAQRRGEAAQTDLF